MAWWTVLLSPITSLISSIVTSWNHSKELKELTRLKEVEIEKTKLELAKQADQADQLIALENLKQPLADRNFRRILFCAIVLPLIMCVPDVLGYPQYGSMIVQTYFNRISQVIPTEYIIFVTSMVASYFGIPMVRNFFKK